jgi:hypothetical protein
LTLSCLSCISCLLLPSLASLSLSPSTPARDHYRPTLTQNPVCIRLQGEMDRLLERFEAWGHERGK